MRIKIILVLLAVMGLICVCCKDNKTVKCEKTTIEVVDSIAVTDTVKVDSLQVNL